MTHFVIVAFGMKPPLSLLRPLRQVQAPTAISSNRCDLGVTYDGDGGILLFFHDQVSTVIPNDVYGWVWS